MADFLKKVLRTRGNNTRDPLDKLPRPGDGIGYPVPYDGRRIQVDYELLKKCKVLSPYSGAYRLNDKVVMKTGEAVRMSEAVAMRLVAEKTSIPVPRVLDAYYQKSDGRGVIMMEYIEGETLDKPWPQYDSAQKQHVIAQLQQYLNKLRTVKGGTIGAVDGSSCCDQFFTAEGTSYGPYSTEREFHRGLAQALLERGNNSWCQMVSRFLASLDGHEIVPTHNDLAPRNILVSDGNVVAMLDWELYGFYPDYWEYVKGYLCAD